MSVAHAKDKLPELIRAAEDGETVTICRRGVPAVDIVRTKKPSRKKRRLGTLKGKIQVLEPEWWKPMSDDEVDAIMAARGKLRLSPVDAQRVLEDLDLRILPYTARHAFYLFDLPPHHADSFDPVVTCDEKFSLYKKLKVLW